MPNAQNENADLGAKKERKKRETNKRFVIALPLEIKYFFTSQYEVHNCTSPQQFARLVMARGLRSMNVTPAQMRTAYAEYLVEAAQRQAEEVASEAESEGFINDGDYGLNF